MNILNKAFLKLALLPAPLYRRMGVNMAQLKVILRTKLTLDDRRPNAIQQAQARKRKKPVSLATAGTMIMSAILGFVFLFAFSMGSNAITHFTFYFSLFFFMLAASLISDFTSVLIDVRDNYIILPKPVTGRTVVTARLLHIFIHICKLVLPMSLPALFSIVPRYGGWGTVLFFFMVLLVTLFALFFINALYILILRITTPQKFNNIISYIQIFFAIAIYSGYQIVPRLAQRYMLSAFDVSAVKGIAFLPLYWFAAAWQVLYRGGGNTIEIIAAALGIIIPFLSLALVIKYLAPSFNNKLALISSSGETAAPAPAGDVKKVAGKSYAHTLSRWTTSFGPERMGFLITWKITSRSRDFKMKVYPGIGYLLVYAVIMLMSNKHITLAEIGDNKLGKTMLISALYSTSLILITALGQAAYSDKYKASWIYYTSPLRQPGAIISGSTKAIILKFYIPIVLIITAAAVAIIGVQVLPNIILGLFNQFLIATLIVYAGNKIFPFSTQQNTNVKAGTFMRTLFVMMMTALIGIGHYFIYNILPAVILCAVLSVAGTWLMMSSIKQASWESIKSNYTEE
jgi:ABC-2 type transport system permease protein